MRPYPGRATELGAQTRPAPLSLARSNVGRDTAGCQRRHEVYAGVPTQNTPRAATARNGQATHIHGTHSRSQGICLFPARQVAAVATDPAAAALTREGRLLPAFSAFGG